MIPGTPVRIVSGPFLTLYGCLGLVRVHAPGRYVSLAVQHGDETRVVDVLPGEFEEVAA